MIEGGSVSEARLTRADDGTRTRDPHLGKVMLYQLSYIRVSFKFTCFFGMLPFGAYPI